MKEVKKNVSCMHKDTRKKQKWLLNHIDGKQSVIRTNFCNKCELDYLLKLLGYLFYRELNFISIVDFYNQNKTIIKNSLEITRQKANKLKKEIDQLNYYIELYKKRCCYCYDCRPVECNKHACQLIHNKRPLIYLFRKVHKKETQLNNVNLKLAQQLQERKELEGLRFRVKKELLNESN